MCRRFADDGTLNGVTGRGLLEGFGSKDGPCLLVGDGNKGFVHNGYLENEAIDGILSPDAPCFRCRLSVSLARCTIAFCFS